MKWEIDHTNIQPIYQQIVTSILTAIKEGQLYPGERLPAERKLAEKLGVNRSTVVHALDELVSLGVVVRRQGSGTHVNAEKWGVASAGATNWRSYLEKGPFTKTDPYLVRLQEQAKTPSLDTIDSFTGELPLALIPSFDFPSSSWKEFLAEEQNQDSLGYLPLRRALSQLMEETYQVTPKIEELLVTSGAQQALFLVCQVLLAQGDGVAIASPSFFYLLPIFQAAGVRLYGIPMDEEGMDLLKLEQSIRKHQLKMVFVHTNFQNPTGITMSARRRADLSALCQRYRIPIVEDDAFGQLFFGEGEQPNVVKKIDQENVIYIGSLSKILGSTTKIGWVNAPQKVVQKLAEARDELEFGLSIFPQVLATQALTSGTFQTKVQALNTELRLRRDACVTAMVAELGERMDLSQPTGGYYLWLTSRGPLFDRDRAEQLLTKRALVLPSFLLGVAADSLRINFARLTPGDSQQLAQRIKAVFES